MCNLLSDIYSYISDFFQKTLAKNTIYRKLFFGSLFFRLIILLKEAPPRSFFQGRPPRGDLVVGVERLELSASWSQTTHATNCATPR